MKKHTRPVSGLWVSGVNPVREALLSDGMSIEEMIIARADPRVQELRERAEKRGIPVRQENKDALSSIVGHSHHQGVALRASEFPYTSFDALLDRPLEERDPLVILDCIQDPQNLGALLRSACFLGAKGILIPKDRSAGVTGAVIKVAAGATSYLPVVQVTNLATALGELKEAGLWIAGLDVEENQSLYDADLSVPLGLVVGNEQKGMRPLIRKHCDFLWQIPVRGPIQSLNAAAAGAIALAEVQRQRFTEKS
jgi:23S rRNA (guanosine2251-2'-O)-methyltransferase